jgi:hypothetical protein
MAVGSDLPQLSGYPFEVRYSDGSQERARAAADVAADAYVYFKQLFSRVEPDIAIVVPDEADWPNSGLPYGLPFFRDDAGEIRPGIVVMSAGGGDFWLAIARDLRHASPHGYAKLLTVYPDGAGGVDLQPFFELITIHELGHAFEVLGDLRLPTFWLSEILRQPGTARVRRNPAAGESANARDGPKRGRGKSEACRSDAGRGVQHARRATSALHGF